ncbi:hypothetical protein [Caulobacter endophyticus]|uniref:Lipoprotein n=1 Tax=Caulobacter endophyticus TaxID=2172652 RepID=A0A2T9KB11_9CAUL|nr:hypothetical protein [Caulobacter endophyticus]PVM93165.1 hypothetical protein DDF67_04030 [Caulobacter endophyticus]
MRLSQAAAVLVLGLSAVGLSACVKQTKAPFDQGICNHVILKEDGTLRFNPVERNVPNMETCAATLEGMRIRFMRMGLRREELTGSYQGKFIFVQKEGIYLGDSYEGARFMSLVRTGDGRLAVPGAMPPR